MTAKQYLENVRKNSYVLKQARQELDDVHSDIYTLRAAGMTEKVSGSNTADLANKYIKVEEYKQKLANAVTEMTDMRNEAKSLIRALQDGRHQAVLYARYINNLEWEDVTDAVNLGWSRTFEIHNDALREFDRIHYDFLQKK